MSSYLTFYAVPKAENSKPIGLISYCRSNDIYQYFSDNIHPAYIGNDEEYHYTELTVEKVDRVLEDLNNDIKKAKIRIEEYEKCANGDTEIIETIIEFREYLENLETALYRTEFIKELVLETKYSNSLKAIYCNVD